MPILEAKQLSMHFGGLKAVDEVDFHVDEGEIVSIIGPNGAGKTTIFNTLTGIYTPTAGDLILNGESLVSLTPQEIVKAGISRTFQNIRLFTDLRVIENVMVGTHIHTKYGFLDLLFRTPKFRRIEKEKTLTAIEILKSIGLENKLDDYATNLPYGEQRKLEIARAIATNPKIILLDEPAAGMNPQESEELVDFIGELRDRGFTIILIEHDMSVVMNIADRIYVIDHGRRIAHGLPEEIANNHEVIEAYLGKEDEAENA